MTESALCLAWIGQPPASCAADKAPARGSVLWAAGRTCFKLAANKRPPCSWLHYSDAWHTRSKCCGLASIARLCSHAARADTHTQHQRSDVSGCPHLQPSSSSCYWPKHLLENHSGLVVCHVMPCCGRLHELVGGCRQVGQLQIVLLSTSGRHRCNNVCCQR